MRTQEKKHQRKQANMNFATNEKMFYQEPEKAEKETSNTKPAKKKRVLEITMVNPSRT